MKNSKIIHIIIIIIALVLCEWFFFRELIGTGELIGDRGDGRLTMLLTEHWWAFFSGSESFTESLMFYPCKEVIGYSDLLFVYGLIHSFFRMLGVNIFSAYKLTIISLHFFGTCATFFLLNRTLNLSYLWSSFGTIAFCYSNAFAINLVHTQLGAICILPILAIFGIDYIKNFWSKKKRNVYAFLFIITFVLLTYNSWYVAYFTALFIFVFTLTFLALVKLNKGDFFSIKEVVANIWKDAIGYLVITTILFIPFIKIYFPVFSNSSGYSFQTCIPYLPGFSDIVNVAESNWMLGWLVKLLEMNSRLGSVEKGMGFSWVLLCMFAVSVAIMLFRNKRKHIRKEEKYVLCSILISIVICCVMIIKVNEEGASLWAIACRIIPAASSVRAIARMLLWISFPMAIVTSYILDKSAIFKSSNKLLLLVPIIIVMTLFMSNVNINSVSHSWNGQDELEFISNVAEPPSQTKVFYIKSNLQDDTPEYIFQVDAFEIATWYSIKTINGYSGQSPPGWDNIWYVNSDEYIREIDKWIEDKKIANVFVYDIGNNTWKKHTRITEKGD